MRVLFTASAERQIEQFFDYIAHQSSESTAELYIRRVVRHCEQLQHSPERGARRDDILQGLRTIGFERRITIAFMICEDAVLIEGIFYGGRDFETILRPLP